jgi:geranylgeranyl diphosphate synthase type II
LSRDVANLLNEYRTRIDEHLRACLRYLDESPGSLREAIDYSLLTPGKRLRPTLALLAAEACGGKTDDALSAGCAVEMVHAYSLIHDDLPAMDDDDLRRGMPTAHKKFGEALAILAGDALQALAFQILASDYSPATAAGMCRELAAAAGGCGMIGGQVDDLIWDGKISGAKVSRDVHGLAGIHSRKTGAMFRASLRLGLLAVQGEQAGLLDAEAAEALESYGRYLGLAFQITDDLLDVEGQTSVAGKRVGKDAGRGKLTYPGLFGIDESRRRVELAIEQAGDALAPLGERGETLAAVARMVGQRDR